MELLNPDFVLLAKAYGIEAACAETVDELKKAVQQAQSTNKPFLIHARVLKEENVLPMVAPNTSLSQTIYYPAKPEKEKEKAKEKLSKM